MTRSSSSWVALALALAGALAGAPAAAQIAAPWAEEEGAPGDPSGDPLPPSDEELADIARDVQRHEVAAMMRHRGRWRVFADVDLWVLGEARFNNGGLSARYDTVAAGALWVGVRRAVTAGIDLQARAGVAGPHPLDYSSAPTACPSGSFPRSAGLGSDGRSTGAALLVEAALRGRPSSVLPFYLGVGVAAGGFVVGGISTAGAECVSSTGATVSAGTAGAASTSVAGMFGASATMGFQFGSREQFDLHMQGWVFNAFGRRDEAIPAFQLGMGWAFL